MIAAVKVVANGLVPVVAPLIVTVPIVVDPDTAAAKTAWVAVIVTPLRVTAQLAVLAPALVAVIVVTAAVELPNDRPVPLQT